jgi:hypothetical protein
MWSSESKATESHPETSQPKPSDKKPRTQVHSFQNLFENTQPAPQISILNKLDGKPLKKNTIYEGFAKYKY